MYVARPTRRQFLRGAGLSTAAIAAGPAVLELTRFAAAGAQQAAGPTPAELASFAESIELATVAAYGSFRPRLSKPAAVAAATTYPRHHQDHANAMGALAGDKRTGKPNAPLLQTLQDRLARAQSENDVIQVAYDLEGGLASTYLFIISSTTDAAVLKACASVLPIDSQHAVVLGSLLGESTKDLTAPDKDQVGYETEDKHFDPSSFPTVATTTTSAIAGK
jgi:hypothetical protein